MKLHDIAVNNLRRRKGKVFFLVMGLLVGVAAVVALLTTTSILEADIDVKMGRIDGDAAMDLLVAELAQIAAARRPTARTRRQA